MHCSEKLSTQFKTNVGILYEKKFGKAHIDQKNIFSSIDQITERFVRAKTLAVENKITSEDFQLIKTNCERKINLLGLEIKNSTVIISKANEIIPDAVKKLQDLNSVLNSCDPELMKKLIDLICEKQVTFDGIKFISLLNAITKNVFGLNEFVEVNHNRRLFIKPEIAGKYSIDQKHSDCNENQNIQSFLESLSEIILQTIINKN